MNLFNCIVTVGPSSLDQQLLSQMKFHGADCFRINLSHSNPINFQKYVDILEDVCIVPSIDTQGAQGRIVKIEGSTKFLEGELVVLNFTSSEKINLSETEALHLLTLNHAEIINQVSHNDIIRIDFSGLILKIKSLDLSNKILLAVVISGGTCTHNRAFDIVSKPLKLEALTDFDLWAIKESRKFSPPAVFHSFAASKVDVVHTRSLISSSSALISKIESKEGLKNIDSIAQNSDGLLVDRGDLSREISISMIPSAVNLVLEIGQKYNTPVYVATNVLDSMMTNPLPSRAEISDMHNLFKQGVQGMVLAAEAAIGQRPLESVQVVSHIKKIVHNQKLGLLGIFDSDEIKVQLSDELAHWL